MSRYRMYGLESKIGFGQYREEGRTIQWIIDHDPGYLVWCLENVDGFDLDDEADLLLEIELDYLEDIGA